MISKIATKSIPLGLMAAALVILTGCGTPALTVDEMVERAAALCDRGRGEEALQLLDQVTAKEEMYPEAYYLKGLAHELNHELLHAKQAYDKCLVQAPENSDALNNRGSVQLRLGQFAEAETDLLKAVQVNPLDDLAWSNLALAQQELGRIEDALVSLRRAISLQKNSVYFVQLGNLLIESGAYAEAEQALSESLELNPRDASAFFSRSIARAKQGQTDSAVKDLDAARAVDAANALHGPIRFAKRDLLQR